MAMNTPKSQWMQQVSVMPEYCALCNTRINPFTLFLRRVIEPDGRDERGWNAHFKCRPVDDDKEAVPA